MVIEDESQNSDVKTEKPIQENKKVKQVQDQKTDKTKNLPVKAAEASDDIHPISKLDIRVGYVKSVVLNTQADKLYNQEIDIGGGEIRKIASGLRGRVEMADLLDSYVIILANLKAKELKGWLSHGMVLCATDEKGITEPLRPAPGSKVGDPVFIGDYPRCPLAELPKNNPWDKVKDEIFVSEDKIANYQTTNLWKTEAGLVQTKSLKNAKIS